MKTFYNSIYVRKHSKHFKLIEKWYHFIGHTLNDDLAYHYLVSIQDQQIPGTTNDGDQPL